MKIATEWAVAVVRIGQTIYLYQQSQRRWAAGAARSR